MGYKYNQLGNASCISPFGLLRMLVSWLCSNACGLFAWDLWKSLALCLWSLNLCHKKRSAANIPRLWQGCWTFLSKCRALMQGTPNCRLLHCRKRSLAQTASVVPLGTIAPGLWGQPPLHASCAALHIGAACCEGPWGCSWDLCVPRIGMANAVHSGEGSRVTRSGLLTRVWSCLL